MRDPFARATASKAHAAAADLERRVKRLEDRLPRPTGFKGRCALCGDPCKGRYCHAHAWAYGR